MGRIVVTEFVSLDGVVEDPGGMGSYAHAGWSFEFDRGDAGNAFKLEETMGSDAQLLGRVTYEEFAASWPERDGEFADKSTRCPSTSSRRRSRTRDGRTRASSRATSTRLSRS